MKVYFIGAGPGDPKLITLKGKEVIEISDIVIYAGSLVNKEILNYAVKAKDTYDSAKMSLDDIEDVFKLAKENNHIVARIHSGDPSIYGAIQEQIDVLESLSISYEVIPGISSFQAAAASIQQELTLPEVCQTITLSRIEGRTPVPSKEKLVHLIKTTPTLFLFLSIGKLEEIVNILKEGYPQGTPVKIFYKVSWPDEKIIHGTLEDIVEKMNATDINMTALILIGEVLNKNGKKSRLYDKNFSHLYRT